MTRRMPALFVSWCAVTAVLVAQTPAPAKPNPELKKLEAYLGSWTYAGDANPHQQSSPNEVDQPLACEQYAGKDRDCHQCGNAAASKHAVIDLQHIEGAGQH